MPWLELETAAARGFSREAWETWIESGHATSYVDGGGRRMVWLEDATPLQMVLQDYRVELTELRQEVSRLRDELHTTLQSSRTTPTATVEVTLSSKATRTLELLEQTWNGSDRELERQAGLPLRFLTKGRRGERNGPRAETSWVRLERFLQSRRAA